MTTTNRSHLNRSTMSSNKEPLLPAAPPTKADALKVKEIDCSQCGKVKPHSEFTKTQLARRLSKKTSENGNKGSCKECVRNYDRMRRYKVTPDMINERLIAQNSKCAMGFCSKPINQETAQVDHDHHTGKVRGLLCTNCNTSLGGLGDKVDKILIAACYLAKDEKNLSSAMLQSVNRSMETLNTWHKTMLAECKPSSSSSSESSSKAQTSK